MKNTLMKKDFYVAQRLYNKILDNKGKFLELLDNILDLTSFIPVCIAEYGKEFKCFNLNDLIINDINYILIEYGLSTIHI